MSTPINIQYIKRSGIITAAWNNCIQSAPNSLIYATHEYLDAVCGDWDALVLGNYEAVMPLVWRKKWGVYYLYYPPFCAALGVFGRHLSAAIITAFLSAIPLKFRYWDFPLNNGNLFQLDSFTLLQRTNYILPLGQDYTAIYRNYRQNLQRNIRRSVQAGFEISRGFPVNEVISLAKLYTPEVMVDHSAYAGFENIYSLLEDRKMAITYGIRNAKGALLASAAFLFDQNRAYYILVGNHPDGKTSGASHAMIDAFIKDHAGQNLTLDFEGSDIRNLAFFYSSFGAIPEYYPVIQLNRLPAPLKWLKK
jgi:hypothetical protein